MNDFTKEELEMLSHHDNMTEELHVKIQSMIDNYCEHEETYYSSGDNIVCSHCHRPAW